MVNVSTAAGIRVAIFAPSLIGDSSTDVVVSVRLPGTLPTIGATNAAPHRGSA